MYALTDSQREVAKSARGMIRARSDGSRSGAVAPARGILYGVLIGSGAWLGFAGLLQIWI